MDGVQALYIALSHGVAVFPDGRGGLTVSAVCAPLDASGRAFLTAHRSEIVKTFKKRRFAEIVNLCLWGYGRTAREMVAEWRGLIGDSQPSPGDYMKAWARVLYCDCLNSWPEVSQ